jgi:Bacterial Ig domain
MTIRRPCLAKHVPSESRSVQPNWRSGPGRLARASRWAQPRTRLRVTALIAVLLGGLVWAVPRGHAAPVVQVDDVSVQTTLSFSLFANDVGATTLQLVNGQALAQGQIEIATTYGTLRCQASGACDYTVAAGAPSGTDSFYYHAADSTGALATTWLYVRVNLSPPTTTPPQPAQPQPVSGNRPPAWVLRSRVLVLFAGETATISAIDREGDAVTYAVLRQATDGSVACDAAGCTYTAPASVEQRIDLSVDLEARDARGAVSGVTVQIRVRIGIGGPGREVATAPPLSSTGKMTIIYEFRELANLLFHGDAQVKGLSVTNRSFRQFPLGRPFPMERWLGKVGHGELQGKSPEAIADLLRRRMSRAKIGQDIASGFVAVDELGKDFEDGATGPALLAAMKILAKTPHAPTKDPLSRRVIFYVAPKMVANVGSGHHRDRWDSALAATRLGGGVFLQMYHASGGRVTSVFTAQEWRDYMPVWARTVPRSLLRPILTNGLGVSQDQQWGRARQTAAGRAILKNGVAAYRLGTKDEALAWLRNWHRYVGA